MQPASRLLHAGDERCSRGGLKSSSITQATLDYLALRLDELAAVFPTSPAAVDVVTLTDDIGVLTHHLQYATERAQERFTAPETVYLPERVALARLAQAAAGIAGALDVLAEALTYATTGFQREAIGPRHLSSAQRPRGHADRHGREIRRGRRPASRNRHSPAPHACPGCVFPAAIGRATDAPACPARASRCDARAPVT
ncbi:hypothetical protein ABT063_33715 [Streptomyces sp. NPDC002838]|uniref:hypothetical protein n=1 Tax=Streptomyces sp. NPDC002838 TaxID=3154436 RepID=UPI00331EBADC